MLKLFALFTKLLTIITVGIDKATDFIEDCATSFSEFCYDVYYKTRALCIRTYTKLLGKYEQAVIDSDKFAATAKVKAKEIKLNAEVTATRVVQAGKKKAKAKAEKADKKAKAVAAKLLDL